MQYQVQYIVVHAIFGLMGDSGTLCRVGYIRWGSQITVLDRW